MLKLSLDYARDLSLSNVLLTCDEGNHASKKVIEKCGGVFEKIANYPPGQREGEFEKKLLYWLSTGKK
jgi:predicted acetyltransferase